MTPEYLAFRASVRAKALRDPDGAMLQLAALSTKIDKALGNLTELEFQKLQRNPREMVIRFQRQAKEASL